MDLTPFKKDIDELIADFSRDESTNFRDMKSVWLSKKFSYIYEASPSTNLAFFMQSLYSHAIGYMNATVSLSVRLGGLYCLYCLYETQPFKPHFKIYISLEELKKLKNLVVTAKENGSKDAPAVVRKLLEKKVFLFGFVDISEGAVAETVNQLTELQNARVQVAYEQLFANTRIHEFIHMDMGMEVELNGIRKISSEYEDAKKLAINEAREVVDVKNIEHIAQDDKHARDALEKVTEEWDAQKEQFRQQTGLCLPHPEDHEQRGQLVVRNEENFDQELERMLSET